MLKTKLSYGTLLLFFAGLSDATTVIVAVSPFGIVIGSDSKQLEVTGNFIPQGNGNTAKIVLVQKRILVTSLGISRVSNQSGDKVSYDFDSWIQEISNRVPVDVSVSQFASVIEAESAKAFSGFAEGVLKTGHLKPRDELQM